MSEVDLRELKELHIVFDGPPGPEPGRFVEVETPSGVSLRLGEWLERPGGYCALVIPNPIRLTAEVERLQEETTRRFRMLEAERLAIGIVSADYEKLRSAFEHTHVACKPGQVDPPGYPDQCQECGLDIRNAIHTRIAAAIRTKPEVTR